jgi:hypothetical protein
MKKRNFTEFGIVKNRRGFPFSTVVLWSRILKGRNAALILYWDLGSQPSLGDSVDVAKACRRINGEGSACLSCFTIVPEKNQHFPPHPKPHLLWLACHTMASTTTVCSFI